MNFARMRHDPKWYGEAIRIHDRYGFGAKIIATMLVVDHGVNIKASAIEQWLKEYRRVRSEQ